MVIILLYVGLLASFSLNVSLLLRKQPPLPPQQHDELAAESAAAAAAGKGREKNAKLKIVKIFVADVSRMRGCKCFIASFLQENAELKIYAYMYLQIINAPWLSFASVTNCCAVSKTACLQDRHPALAV